MPMNWHPLPLTTSTKKALMDSFSHYSNFSYDEQKGGFLVEVPVPPGRGKVPRATPAILKDQVEVDIKLTRGGSCATCQPRRPHKQCYSWWLGQLIHYGLQLEMSADEAKQVVKNAMVQGNLKVPVHLKKMEQSMRTAANRRAKKRGVRLAAKSSASKKRHQSIKSEPVASDYEIDSDVVPVAASRKSRSGRNIKKRNSSESSSNFVSNYDSSGSETDSGTLEAVPSKAIINDIGVIAKNKAAIVKVQSKKAPSTAASRRKARNKSLADTSISESSDSELEGIPYHLIGTKVQQDGTEVHSHAYDPVSNKSAFTMTHPISGDSDNDNSNSDIFSGDSEYERAVVAHAEAIDGGSARYGETDTDTSSHSTSDNEVKAWSVSRSSERKPHNSARSTQNTPLSNTSTHTSRLIASQPAEKKQLLIQRDRKPLPEELEQASTCETTPSHTPKNRLKHNRFSAEPIATADAVIAPIDNHPDMRYEDVHDPIMRKHIAKMRSVFPNETVYLCYICLAKHNSNYDKGCEELVKVTMASTPKQPARAPAEIAHNAPLSTKRRRSSSVKQPTAQESSPAKRQDPITLSDSDEPIVKHESSPKRRKASRSKRRVSIIPDNMHGSQIDLTMVDEAEILKDDSLSRAHERDLEIIRNEKPALIEKLMPKILHAVSVEIPSSPAVKSHTANRLKNQDAFPSSPPVGSRLKGILKSSPLFRPRDAGLSKSLTSTEMITGQPSTTSSDLPLYSQQKKLDPELPPQASLSKPHQGAAPQHRVSWNSYTTDSGWQALNPNNKSKMRSSGQIEVEAQREPHRTLFPPAHNNLAALYGQSGSGLLHRGVVKNPSLSNSTSSKKKHRVEGF